MLFPGPDAVCFIIDQPEPLLRLSVSINDALDNYRSYGRKYSYTFEGDDQLKELSDGISELAAENRQLRHRISQLRDKHKEEE